MALIVKDVIDISLRDAVDVDISDYISIKKVAKRLSLPATKLPRKAALLLRYMWVGVYIRCTVR